MTRNEEEARLQSQSQSRSRDPAQCSYTAARGEFDAPPGQPVWRTTTTTPTGHSRRARRTISTDAHLHAVDHGRVLEARDRPLGDALDLGRRLLLGDDDVRHVVELVLDEVVGVDRLVRVVELLDEEERERHDTEHDHVRQRLRVRVPNTHPRNAQGTERNERNETER